MKKQNSVKLSATRVQEHRSLQTMTPITIQKRKETCMFGVPLMKGRIWMRGNVIAQACLSIALITLVVLPTRTTIDEPISRPTKHNKAWKRSLRRHAVEAPEPLIIQSTGSMLQRNVKPAKVSTATMDSISSVPNFFTELVPWQSLLARNNILTVYTGCSIATWTYGWDISKRRLGPYYDDCGHYSNEKGWQGRDITPETVSSLRDGDSIYVELMKLDHFAEHMLPLIHVNFVLISGQNHIAPMKPPLKPPYDRRLFRRVINNPYMTHWFMMNLDKHSYDPFHQKMHPFPYGLSHVAKGSKRPADFNVNSKNIYLDELHGNRTKSTNIFVGYISQKSNPYRALVPQGEKVPQKEYYQKVHESKYILSPDGDRPECYRHYEAIGLGTMPITQLHPHLYRHLRGNVVFNETKWNLRELEATLPQNTKVNRRVLFEEYWMEYVERVVGRPMRWWDPSRASRLLLSEITTTMMEQIRMESV